TLLRRAHLVSAVCLTCFVLLFFVVFFYCSGPHLDLHSFPTRRSSDLSDLYRPGCGCALSGCRGRVVLLDHAIAVTAKPDVTLVVHKATVGAMWQVGGVSVVGSGLNEHGVAKTGDHLAVGVVFHDRWRRH